MERDADVVVVGAGIVGCATAYFLARRGARVVVVERGPVPGEQTRRLGQSDGESRQLQPGEQVNDWIVVRAIEEVAARCGRIDVVVNNAGYGVVDLMEAVTLTQAQRQFDTNFFGALRMNRAVLPIMRRQGSGLLLKVSSGAGRLAIPAMGLYCASKYAVEALAEVYRYELASLGIDSVLIEPGAYRTPIMGKLEQGEDQSRKAGYGEMAGVPGKVSASLSSTQANPQEIADSVVQIIETPAGQRPLRYRVSSNDLGISRINAVTDEVQSKVLEAFGLTELTRFKAH